MVLTVFYSCNKVYTNPINEVNLILGSNIQKEDIEMLECRNEFAYTGDSYLICSFRIKENRFNKLLKEIKIKDFSIYEDSIINLNSKNDFKLSIDINKKLILYNKIIE